MNQSQSPNAEQQSNATVVPPGYPTPPAGYPIPFLTLVKVNFANNINIYLQLPKPGNFWVFWTITAGASGPVPSLVYRQNGTHIFRSIPPDGSGAVVSPVGLFDSFLFQPNAFPDSNTYSISFYFTYSS